MFGARILVGIVVLCRLITVCSASFYAPASAVTHPNHPPSCRACPAVMRGSTNLALMHPHGYIFGDDVCPCGFDQNHPPPPPPPPLPLPPPPIFRQPPPPPSLQPYMSIASTGIRTPASRSPIPSPQYAASPPPRARPIPLGANQAYAAITRPRVQSHDRLQPVVYAPPPPPSPFSPITTGRKPTLTTNARVQLTANKIEQDLNERVAQVLKKVEAAHMQSPDFFERQMPALALAAKTVVDDDPKCNNGEFRALIQRAVQAGDPNIAKRALIRSAEILYGSSSHLDVICSMAPFSYRVATPQFCEFRAKGVTCLLYEHP